MSFESFVVGYAPQLARSAALMLDGHRQDVDDVVQETLIVVYKRWGAITGDERAVRAYAYTTMVRMIGRLRKREALRRSREEHTFQETGSQDFAYLDDNLRVALSLLPLRQKQTVVLRYYADLSVAVTANIMHCSESTVKSQSADAVAALGEHLSQLRAEEGR